MDNCQRVARRIKKRNRLLFLVESVQSAAFEFQPLADMQNSRLCSACSVGVFSLSKNSPSLPRDGQLLEERYPLTFTDAHRPALVDTGNHQLWQSSTLIDWLGASHQMPPIECLFNKRRSNSLALQRKSRPHSSPSRRNARHVQTIRILWNL